MCIRDRYIAKANGYKGWIVESLIKKHRKKKNNIELEGNNRNKVTYIASEYGNTLPKILNNVFSDVNIKIAFRTNNNVNKILLPKNSKSVEDRTCVYKIMCNDCDSFYIGQTGRSFKKRFKAVSYTHLDVYKRQVFSLRVLE